MSRRRNSTIIDDFIPGINLNRAEQFELQTHFKKIPITTGGISFYDFVKTLKNNYQINENLRNLLLKQIAFKQIKILDLNTLIWAASYLKKIQDEKKGNNQKQENQYYYSFIALGGNADKSGFVSRNTLMKTMTDQFGISLDANKPIIGLQGLEQEKLNYEQFCDLFKSRESDRQIINPEQQNRRVRTDTMKTVIVDDSEFKEYLQALQDDSS